MTTGVTRRRAAPTRPADRVRAICARLRPTDREVLGWWLVTRLGILAVASAAPHVVGDEDAPPGFLARWQQWDFWHFDRIASVGYFEPGWRDPVEAFFPGLPLLLRAGAWLGIPTVVGGLVVSAVGGGVAAVALARLADREFCPGAGRLAALAWMVAPPAVFLAAPYTEALFLACALPAWLAARQGRWPLAALLAAGACTIRVSGLFLALALGVVFVTSRPRQWTQLPWLGLPAVPVLAYMAYLWANTGDWLRWYHAQADAWYRGFTGPHEALAHTWAAAYGGEQAANFAWMFRAELAAMLVGIVLTIVLLVLRRWAEATWVGVQVVAFATSYWFFSVPRASLLWFPLWMLLGALGMASTRRIWVWRTYMAVATPLCGVWAAAYLTGAWAG